MTCARLAARVKGENDGRMTLETVGTLWIDLAYSTGRSTAPVSVLVGQDVFLFYQHFV